MARVSFIFVALLAFLLQPCMFHPWQVIANHVKNCSDAFDSSIIALVSVIPSGQFSPKLTADNAATLNTRFISSTSTILGHLNTLLLGKAFFEGVNGNQQMRIVPCH
ncbi:hypothetical protein B0H14DRAFT_3483657 [Mycena olivaceomarginata]|nr:hypothetical protein B0H14DRAFT_3483657 [Mycena olivaceomarginata]